MFSPLVLISLLSILCGIDHVYIAGTLSGSVTALIQLYSTTSFQYSETFLMRKLFLMLICFLLVSSFYQLSALFLQSS